MAILTRWIVIAITYPSRLCVSGPNGQPRRACGWPTCAFVIEHSKARAVKLAIQCNVSAHVVSHCLALDETQSHIRSNLNAPSYCGRQQWPLCIKGRETARKVFRHPGFNNVTEKASAYCCGVGVVL